MKTINYEDNPEFNEFLDEVWGEVSIAGYTYQCSIALFNLDVTAYIETLANWEDDRV